MSKGLGELEKVGLVVVGVVAGELEVVDVIVGECLGDDGKIFPLAAAPPASSSTSATTSDAIPVPVDSHSRNSPSRDFCSGFSLREFPGLPSCGDGSFGGQPCPVGYHRPSGACHGCCPDIRLTRRLICGGVSPRHLEPRRLLCAQQAHLLSPSLPSLLWLDRDDTDPGRKER